MASDLLDQKDEERSKLAKAMNHLIKELLKDRPEQDQTVIQTKMSELGLNYTTDPLLQMNAVIKALHPDEA